MPFLLYPEKPPLLVSTCDPPRSGELPHRNNVVLVFAVTYWDFLLIGSIARAHRQQGRYGEHNPRHPLTNANLLGFLQNMLSI